MNNNENRSMYINLIVGTIGLIMIGLGIIRYFTLINDSQGYLLTLIGYALVNGYIFYLEKKAGISNRIVWIQSIVAISTLAIISALIYL